MTAVTADAIAGCLARNTFKDALVVVDRCLHLGDECDLLVVHRSLRYIDVEVKVSRADLKADRRKAKWFHTPQYHWPSHAPRPEPRPRDWPRRVWKHYYAMPAAIWKDELLDHCGRVSGVLLVHPREGKAPRWWRVECRRPAKPCRDVETASAADVAAIARLASLRMWDAYADVERLRVELRHLQLCLNRGAA